MLSIFFHSTKNQQVSENLAPQKKIVNLEKKIVHELDIYYKINAKKEGKTVQLYNMAHGAYEKAQDALFNLNLLRIEASMEPIDFDELIKAYEKQLKSSHESQAPRSPR